LVYGKRVKVLKRNTLPNCVGVAKSIDEASLIKSRFDDDTEMEGIKIFRKGK
jgi:hypothetical protein